MSTSIWMHAGPDPFPSLRGNYRTDVAVIGGGISGITAALLLREAGKSVILLDKSEPPDGESARTTAHLTEVLDYRFSELLHMYGRDQTLEIATAARRGVDAIAERVSRENIACDFETLSAYLFTENFEEREYLAEEFAALKTLGVYCKMSDSAPLPYKTVGSLEIPAQAQFHPTKYLRALLSLLRDRGGLIFGTSKVVQITHGEPCEVLTDHARVLATDVVVCTNDPISHQVFMQTKIAAYRTYAIAVKAGLGLPVNGLFWDTDEPYHYIRNAKNGQGTLLVIGGEDHKTGTEPDTERCLQRLKQYAADRFHAESVEYEWSGQIIETVDRLPYIGQDTQNPHYFIATGFSGNGMTLGSLAAEIIAHQILGTRDRFGELFRPNRLNPTVSAGRYVSENKDFPICFIGDRIREAQSVDELRAGEGAIVKMSSKRVAAFKSTTGEIRCFSPVCPHMGCYVRWNKLEKTWDCPCHGSRFDDKGKVLNGPAMEGLKPLLMEEQIEKLAVNQNFRN